MLVETDALIASGLTNPVAMVNDGAGAATQATINTAPQSAGF